MNSRDLSERLDELATRLEAVGDVGYRKVMLQVAEELRQLSNEKYAPGNGMAWTDIKPKTAKKTFTDKSGRKLPF